jgi:hypothetical protein
VCIQAGALATQDVDLLWAARKRVQFVSMMARLDSSMLTLLQRADAFLNTPRFEQTVVSATGRMAHMLDEQSLLV